MARALAYRASLLFLASSVALAAACGSDDSPPPEGGGPASAAPTSSSPSSPADGGGSRDGSAPPETVFPKSFLFGTATAGFQVEMGCPTIAAAECEDRRSDWYQWITTPRILNNPLLFMSKDPPSSGPGFYELFERDFDLAKKELHGDSVRVSLEWSRIFPESTFGAATLDDMAKLADPKALAFYHRVFAAMKARGLVPLVTLNHYSLPLWIHDGAMCNDNGVVPVPGAGLANCIAAGVAGWANPNRNVITGEISKYAAFAAREFGGEVDLWATLNEPFSAVVMPGYVISIPFRSNPPGLSGPWMSLSGAKTAAYAMIEANAKMYDAVKQYDTKDADGDGTKASVGLVYALNHMDPKTTSKEDAEATVLGDYFLHDMFLDGIVSGVVDENWDAGPGKGTKRPDLARKLDWLGINYYYRFPVAKAAIAPGQLVSPFVQFDLGAAWDPQPESIYPVIMRARKYGVPLYISETGRVQDDERQGAAWFVRTLAQIRRARAEGADVRGIFAWSLTDNYEWNHGMHMRFGLYAVDVGTKARYPREVVKAYGRIAKERDVPEDLLTQYANVVFK